MTEPEQWANPACRGKPSDWFFPLVSPGRLGQAGNWGRARRICEGCEHQAECVEWAIAQVELHGIWGGLTPAERDREREARRRAGVPICPVCAVRPPHHQALAAHLSDRHSLSHPTRKLTTSKENR